MTKQQKIKSLLLFFGLIVGLLIIYLANQHFDKGTVALNGNRVKVEIASTPQQWAQGLSNRDGLKQNNGLLFVYPDYLYRNFWMKDMKFEIDIIWIAENKIVGIEKNVPLPTTVPIPTYRSPKPVNYVLEVTAGYADQHHLQIGDPVIFNL
ncbi:MAG: DUF192 domain-containing protein [Candidatus Buchananbacteria bacterium]|nr:DUF192 domain-containing protein [Candidatus Buchananbacteria bacterium]